MQCKKVFRHVKCPGWIDKKDIFGLNAFINFKIDGLPDIRIDRG